MFSIRDHTGIAANIEYLGCTPSFLAWHSPWVVNWRAYARFGLVEDGTRSIKNQCGIHPLATFKVGTPVSTLRADEHWLEYAQGLNETGIVFEERSGYLPAEISARALIKQLAHFGTVEGEGSHDINNTVEGWLRYLDEIYIGSFRPLTYEEAIKGISDESGTLEPLALSKSSGFGFTNIHSDKRGWVEEDDELLRELVDWTIDERKKGNVALWFVKGSEKVEKRDWTRVKNFKTRLFMAQCIVETIANRMVRGDYTRKFMKSGRMLQFYSAAGMETYSGNWNEFIRYVTGNLINWPLNTEDVPTFDKLYPHASHGADGESLSMLMSDPDWRGAVVRTFVADAYDPIVLTISGDMFIPDRHNPSGTDKTIVANCREMERNILYAWLKSDGGAQSPDWNASESLSRFYRYVRHKVLGDDLVYVLSPGCPMTKEHLYHAFARKGWHLEPPEGWTGAPDDSYFAGRRSTLSQIGGWDIFLPVIDRNRILAVNEWRKGRHDPVKQLMRSYAAAELAFPLLFEPGEYLFAVLYDYYLYLKKRALHTGHEELVKTALGLPNYEQMWRSYTGYPCPVEELNGLVSMQRNCARERSKHAGS